MSNDAAKVLVIDSGFGGLSVASEIRQLMPTCCVDYFADNKFFPYGPKSEEQITQRLISVVEQLLPLSKPDLTVIACNTASTIALKSLRQANQHTFVGVVPAIKPAAIHGASIGVLATEATVNGSYINQLIDNFANDCQVSLWGSKTLVHLAEEKLLGKIINKTEIEKEIKNLENQYEIKFNKAAKFDSIVLACTHFPLLKEEFISVTKERYKFIDSGEAIARRVFDLLNEKENNKLEKTTDFSNKISTLFLSEQKAITPSLKENIERFLRSSFNLKLIR